MTVQEIEAFSKHILLPILGCILALGYFYSIIPITNSIDSIFGSKTNKLHRLVLVVGNIAFFMK